MNSYCIFNACAKFIRVVLPRFLMVSCSKALVFSKHFNHFSCMTNWVLQTLFAGAGWTEFLAFRRLHPWPIWALGSLCQFTRRLQVG